MESSYNYFLANGLVSLSLHLYQTLFINSFDAVYISGFYSLAVVSTDESMIVQASLRCDDFEPNCKHSGAEHVCYMLDLYCIVVLLHLFLCACSQNFQGLCLIKSDPYEP